MINVTLNGAKLAVNFLELNYKNGDLSVAIGTTTNQDRELLSTDLFLNYGSRDLFLTSLLEAFQTPANLSGYQYLKRALELGMDNPNVFSSITKDVYPVIAQEFGGVTTAKVERSLHSVILAIVNNKNQNYLKEFFGPSYETLKTKKHNSFVLSNMVNRIKLILSQHPLDTEK